MSKKLCCGTNKEGKPCGSLANHGDYCQFHAPELETERAEWRAKGGKNRSNSARAKKAIMEAAPTDLSQVDALLRGAMVGVLAGTLPARDAMALAALARASAAIREAVETDRRLDAIEAQLEAAPDMSTTKRLQRIEDQALGTALVELHTVLAVEGRALTDDQYGHLTSAEIMETMGEGIESGADGSDWISALTAFIDRGGAPGRATAAIAARFGELWPLGTPPLTIIRDMATLVRRNAAGEAAQ